MRHSTGLSFRRFPFLLLTAFVVTSCVAPDGSSQGGSGSGASASGAETANNPHNASVTKGPLSEISYSVGVAVGQRLVFTGSQDSTSTGLVDIYDVQSKTWNTDKLSAPRNSMGTAVIGTKAYFVGGISPAAQQFDLIDIYDSTSGIWSTDHLNMARANAAVVSIGNILIVGGGVNTTNSTQTIPNAGTNSLTSIEAIDTGNGNRQQASLSVPRSSLAAVAIGGKAYFIGGFPCYYAYLAVCDASNTIDVYDPSNNSVVTMALPHRRAQHSAAVVGTKIVIGSGASHAGILDTIDIYDTANTQWQTISVAQLNTTGSVAVSVGSYVIFAGADFDVNQSGRTVMRYDSNTGLVEVSDMLTYGRYNLAGAVLNGVAYFAGGVTASSEQSLTIETWNSQTNKWGFFQN